MNWTLVLSILGGWIVLAVAVGFLVGAAADLMGEVDE